MGPHAQPIVAQATASGRGAVGVVRASGPHLAPLVRAVCGRDLPPREATLVDFCDDDGSAIDRGLALFFPAPHSYTGEDVLELQGHGGPVVMQLLLARCLRAMPGARLAEPGEFTLRAFVNDKLDLAQAEAVADLIDAGTEQAARSASRSLAGALSSRVQSLANDLVRLRTLVEATLDFPEEDIDFLHRDDAHGQLQQLRAGLSALSAQATQGVLLRDGLRVVIAGQPNVGKSALLNALAGEELAIVTPVAGTTRDRISQTLNIQGVPLHVSDTAGLRPSEQASDEVERIGMSKTWQALQHADAILWVRDLQRMGCDPAYDDQDRDIAQRLPRAVPVVQVLNKADVLHAGQAGGQAPSGVPPPLPSGVAVALTVQVSATQGLGVHALGRALLQLAGAGDTGQGAFSARGRHLQALGACQDALGAAAQHLGAAHPALELLAEELRLAHHHLQSITGEFSNEDLLGEIFGRFCIGK